jgi:Cu-Zn family superoxide dismutase
MRQAWRGLAALVAAGALATGASAAAAHDHGGNGNGDGDNGFAAPAIFTMDAADGAPEGIAFDKRSGQFFVSRTGTGAIFTGKPDAPGALTAFIAGFDTTNPNPVATGMKVRDGLLYVAGAATGQIRIYDLADPTKPPVVFETGGGFINDLDLDRDGDVFATDSSKPFIYKIDAASVKAGSGPVVAINVAPEIQVDPDAFNLNGIVAKGDDSVIVIQSNTGKLFRITLGGDRRDDDHGDHHGDGRRAHAAQAPPPAPAVERTIKEIPVEGGSLKGGDGILFDRGRLLVVQGEGTTDKTKNGQISVVKLRHHKSEARVEDVVGDPSLLGPSTIARARNLLLVVNANFDGAQTASQFTVSGLDRHVVGHRGHGKRDDDRKRDDHADRKRDDDRSGSGRGGDDNGGRDDNAGDDRSGGGSGGSGDDNGGGSSGHR